MSKYAVINLKTDPQLKELAVKTADKLGISISAILNNELRRFTAEQSVVFETPEVPNIKTAHQLDLSNKQIIAGDYHKFRDNKKSLDFLANSLK
jgi:antitoxin component of RelBE/YafQ-DinJ toxin-antitoxin module